jgi:hypothetical protein
MTQTKCSRTVCKRTTTDPDKAGWTYFELPRRSSPTIAGWWCPQCAEEFDDADEQFMWLVDIVEEFFASALRTEGHLEHLWRDNVGNWRTGWYSNEGIGDEEIENDVIEYSF